MPNLYESLTQFVFSNTAVERAFFHTDSALTARQIQDWIEGLREKSGKKPDKSAEHRASLELYEQFLFEQFHEQKTIYKFISERKLYGVEGYREAYKLLRIARAYGDIDDKDYVAGLKMLNCGKKSYHALNKRNFQLLIAQERISEGAIAEFGAKKAAKLQVVNGAFARDGGAASMNAVLFPTLSSQILAKLKVIIATTWKMSGILGSILGIFAVAFVAPEFIFPALCSISWLSTLLSLGYSGLALGVFPVMLQQNFTSLRLLGKLAYVLGAIIIGLPLVLGAVIGKLSLATACTLTATILGALILTPVFLVQNLVTRNKIWQLGLAKPSENDNAFYRQSEKTVICTNLYRHPKFNPNSIVVQRASEIQAIRRRKGKAG